MLFFPVVNGRLEAAVRRIHVGQRIINNPYIFYEQPMVLDGVLTFENLVKAGLELLKVAGNVDYVESNYQIGSGLRYLSESIENGAKDIFVLSRKVGVCAFYHIERHGDCRILITFVETDVVRRRES